MDVEGNQSSGSHPSSDDALNGCLKCFAWISAEGLAVTLWVPSGRATVDRFICSWLSRNPFIGIASSNIPHHKGGAAKCSPSCPVTPPTHYMEKFQQTVGLLARSDLIPRVFFPPATVFFKASLQCTRPQPVFVTPLLHHGDNRFCFVLPSDTAKLVLTVARTSLLRSCHHLLLPRRSNDPNLAG